MGFQLKLCEITPKMLLSNLSRVSSFSCFIASGNKRLNFNMLTLRLWKKWQRRLTYFDQFIWRRQVPTEHKLKRNEFKASIFLDFHEIAIQIISSHFMQSHIINNRN